MLRSASNRIRLAMKNLRRLSNRKSLKGLYRQRYLQPALEGLEPRLLLAADDMISVGRVLSAWTTPDIQNQELKVTYTVYNQQSSDVTGTLLTTTLEPGVTFKSATQLPDQNGQDLAWSLGTIPAFGRASVEVTVVLATNILLQIDGGAHAFGIVDAAAVSDAVPAAKLRTDVIAPALLASTPDANTTDPFIQAVAAKYDYDPNQFFQFLTKDVGYESYVGSLRGARGTLWSNAGNALDEASLGIALLRSSGIPAQYVQGTLSDQLSQQLILSMFPASYQTVGYIPAGTPTADPANDPQLLSETRQHYWFQFDTGSGMKDADSTFSSSAVGQTFTASQGIFAEVPDALRHKTEIKLNAEIFNTASSLFGGLGGGLTTSTVLDQTFNDVELVGKSLTIGNFVNSNNFGAVFTSTTNTYSPYLQVSNDRFDYESGQLIRGTDYQEVFTNFPFGTQILTGLFLKIDQISPDQPIVSNDRTLFDRIGFVSRQTGNSGNLSIAPDSGPVFSNYDLTSINNFVSKIPAGLAARAIEAGQRISERLRQITPLVQNADFSNPENEFLAEQATALLTATIVNNLISKALTFASLSGPATSQLAATSFVKAYEISPRIVLVSSAFTFSPDGTNPILRFSIDLRQDKVRVVPAPGQLPSAVFGFNFQRGINESKFEATAASPPGTQQSNGTIRISIGTSTIFDAATNQNIALVAIDSSKLASLDAMQISAEAKARISIAVLGGKIVIVPTQAVKIDGVDAIGWYETDAKTGETIGLLEDGSHGALADFAAYVKNLAITITKIKGYSTGLAFAFSFIGGYFDETLTFQLFFLIHPKVSVAGISDRKATALAALAESVAISEKFCYAIGLIAGGFDPSIGSAVKAGCEFGVATAAAFISFALKIDPPLPQGKLNLSAPNELFPNPDLRLRDNNLTANLTGGVVSGQSSHESVQVSGNFAATWSTVASTQFAVNSILSDAATVRDASGIVVGSGQVSVASSAPLSGIASGNIQYQFNGYGSLSFYGPAESTVGASGDWKNYSANLSGAVSIKLSTEMLRLNGVTLPMGEYTISTAVAALSGEGMTATPTFAGAIDVTLSDCVVYLGPGSGNLSIGGTALDVTQHTTLTGFTGTLDFNANASRSDNLTLKGTTNNVIALSAISSTLVANQNTPTAFDINFKTSLSDTYHLAIQAPLGWALSIDANGHATVLPEAGIQAGTYRLDILAQSSANADLIVHGVVNVTVIPTQPGIELGVEADPIFTVPFENSLLPTAFRATIQQLGSESDAISLSFANVPNGFNITQSVTQLTIPAGQTGIVGFYVVPSPGNILPSPGTVLSFSVIATSVSNTAITKTQIVNFTMPAIHAVTLVGSSPTVNTTPGVSVNDVVTITNVGNVPETISFAATTSSGLSVSGLSTVTLAVGESTTQSSVLTPDQNTPLNRTLNATITAAFGPVDSPQTQTLQIPVRVAVPGADAIATAATAASQLGKADLANRLSDLSIALTNLVQDPTNEVYRLQGLASLDAALILLAADPITAPSVQFPLKSDRATLNAATTADQVQSAVIQLGNDLQSVASTLADEAKYKFSFSLVSNSKVGAPQVPTTYQVLLQNTGNQPTTYDLFLSGLSGGQTGSVSPSSITLQPGQVSPGSPGVPDITVTITSTSTTQITPFSFQLKAAVHNALEINASVTGLFIPRAETIKVVSVTAAPPFTNPGGKVAIKTSILNAVNRQQTANLTYTISDAQNNVVFTSPGVPVTLNVLTTLTPVDLGQFDTTGLANGNYTITVSVNGATGTGTLLVGTPVTATLATTPITVPAGATNVTNILQIDSQTPLAEPFTLVGQFPATGSNGVAVLGNTAYVGSSSGIRVINVTNPAQPQDLSTIGTTDIAGNTIVQLQVYQNELIVLATTFAGAQNRLLVYSLANPSSPTLLGQTSLAFNGTTATVLSLNLDAIANNLVFTSAFWYRYHIFGNDIFEQFGESFVIDISNPTAPSVKSVVYNLPPDPANQDGYPDGSSNIWQAVSASDNVELIATTTATGSVYTGPSVKGIVMVVDKSNPSAPVVLQKLEIPNMGVVTGISVQGNRAFIIGSTEYWGGGVVGLVGNLVTGMLDLSNPQAPTVIGTHVTSISANGIGNPLSLGNNRYVTTSIARPSTASAAIFFDATNPNNISVTQQIVPAVVNYSATNNGLLFTVDGSNLLIYSLATTQLRIPVTASVKIPKNTNVAIDTNSFNVPPTQIISGTTFDTLVWNTVLTAVSPSRTFTWLSRVSFLQPGEARAVELGGTVDFTSQGAAGKVPLSTQLVTGQQIIGISPTIQTIAPGAVANYTVTLKNPSGIPLTFETTVVGLPPGWALIPFGTVVQPGTTVTVPLTITSNSFAPLTDYTFSVLARTNAGAQSFVEASLVLQGAPVLPDSASHGVVVSLAPISATAGQGTSANYVVRVTNAGSSTDSFHLSRPDLPVGFTANFGATDVTIPPGESNFIDVPLTIVPPLGSVAMDYPFKVNVNSNSLARVSNSTAGVVTVSSLGVAVDIIPTMAVPGDSLVVLVTNTGQQTETYALSLGGPVGLVSTLSQTSITLAPGEQQTVSVTVGEIDFAVPGSLNLTVMAQSQTNAAVSASDSLGVTIDGIKRAGIAFVPDTMQIAAPGNASFLLNVYNTGNVEDAYSATIVGTTGPITASLVGLDGLPTQSIATFRLPGLATGALLLHTTLGTFGTGTAHIQIRSLTDNSIVADATANLSASTETTTNLSISATNANQAEGKSGFTPFTFTVTRSGDVSGTTTVNYTVTGSGTNPANATDFGGTFPSGQVTFAANDLTKTITINVSGDSTVEPDESFAVLLSNANGATILTAAAVGTIRNDDVLPTTLSIAATSADKAEGNSGNTPFTFSVTRTGDVSGTTIVKYTVTGSGVFPADATDFGNALPSGQVSFAPNETSKIITINVHGDTTNEPNEKFTVTISSTGSSVVIANASAIGTIRNDDAATGFSLTCSSLHVGLNTCTVLGATPGGVVDLVKGIQPGIRYLQRFKVQVNMLDPTVVAQGIVQPDGHAIVQFTIANEQLLQQVLLQAFEQAPTPRTSNIVLVAAPLLSADGTGGSLRSLSSSVLPLILATAISRWTASGISNTEANLLNSVTVSVVDLPTGMLGETVDNRVYVDITAAGLGWFVDSTPSDDFEFDIAVSTTERVASAGSSAATGIDLLTVLMHELGHVLGYADVTTDSTGPLMSASLPQGTRRLPNNGTFNVLQTFSALDTNHDGIISPIDVLLIINQLNLRSLNSSQLSNAIPARLDTNGDGILSPIDCLLVINYLNRRKANAEGPANAEGERSTAIDQQSTSLSTISVQADVDNDLISTLAADGWVNGRRKSLRKN